MIKATKDLMLPATITGSLPRPAWYTENLADAALQGRDRGRPLSRAVHRCRRDVPARPGARRPRHRDRRRRAVRHRRRRHELVSVSRAALQGLAGGDYYRVRKGYGGTAKGDIIFEVMESRVMPRCVDKIERGPLQYAALWKMAQGITAGR